MTRRNLLADAALGAAVFALLLGIAAAGGLDAEPGGRDLDLRGVALIAAATLPVAGRRLAPLPAFAAVSAAMIALWSLDYRTDIPFGPLIMVYTLASLYGGARWGRRIWPVLAVAALCLATLLMYLAEGIGLADILLPEMLMWTLLLAGLWVAGDLGRLRRERIAELADRARRTEREAERERRITAAEERTRIARELHDSAGHAINVILVQAGAARLLHERDPAASKHAIATIEQVARDTIGEIDRLVRALREDAGDEPVPADPAAIEELVERHRAAGLRVDTELTDLRGNGRVLPRSVAWAAYRILQEALTNAARHGRGYASVRVRFGPEAVELTVTNPADDSGAASAPGGTGRPGVPGRSGGDGQAGGHGIVGMRERASLLGGVLETGLRDGGFRLYARLPLAADAVGAADVVDVADAAGTASPVDAVVTAGAAPAEPTVPAAA